MGCFFSRRRKPAQGGQQQQQQAAAAGGAGQDAAAGEEKAPQYSWDQRAKVPPRPLPPNPPPPGRGQPLPGYRLSWRAAPGPRLPHGVCGAVAVAGPLRPLDTGGGVGGACSPAGARTHPPYRCYGSVGAVQCVYLKKKKKVFSLRILPGSLKLCKRRGRHAGSGGRRLCQHRSPVRLRPRGGRAGRGQLTLRARAGGRGRGGGRQLGCGSRRGWRVYACRPSGFLIPRGVPWPCASPERTDAVALAGSRSAVCAGVG